MATRPRDRVYVRFIGPADRLHGEYRGQPVELLDDTTEAGALVRFPPMVLRPWCTVTT